MATAKKKAPKKKAAAKKAAAPSPPASQNDLVEVLNISTRTVNTLGGPIKAGEKGKTTVAQARQFRRCLEVI